MDADNVLTSTTKKFTLLHNRGTLAVQASASISRWQHSSDAGPGFNAVNLRAWHRVQGSGGTIASAPRSRYVNHPVICGHQDLACSQSGVKFAFFEFMYWRTSVTRLRLLFGILASFCLLSVAYAVDDYSPIINIFKGSPTVKPFFSNSYGYAVFPSIGKGAVGVGGAYGKGQVYRGDKVTGYTSMKQLTIGFQLGGQSYSQIIFFQNKSAYDKFTTGEFEFGAQATAVAITAGATAGAGTTGTTAGANVGKESGAQDASYHDGMAVFTHVKGGLMYEASIGGQKFRFKPL